MRKAQLHQGPQAFGWRLRAETEVAMSFINRVLSSTYEVVQPERQEAVESVSPSLAVFDIELNGFNGFYQLVVNTQDGSEWLLANVEWDEWQGSVEDGIAIDDTRYAMEVAEAALAEGLAVGVNGFVMEVR